MHNNHALINTMTLSVYNTHSTLLILHKYYIISYRARRHAEAVVVVEKAEVLVEAGAKCPTIHEFRQQEHDRGALLK
jgi:hypothetical protein